MRLFEERRHLKGLILPEEFKISELECIFCVCVLFVFVLFFFHAKTTNWFQVVKKARSIKLTQVASQDANGAEPEICCIVNLLYSAFGKLEIQCLGRGKSASN